jgi:hypothetical protein
MACGHDTAHAVSLNAEGHKRNVAMGCLLHLTAFGLLWEAIRILRQKRVRIPICWQCHMRSILPDPKLARKIWLFVGLLSASCILFGTNHAGFGLLALLPAFAVLVRLVRENRAHVRDYLPIEVTFSSDRYQYAVYSGPFRDFLLSQGVGCKFVVQSPAAVSAAAE